MIMLDVLIVDDEKLQRTILSFMLKKYIPKITYEDAEDGNFAIEKVLNNEIKLILMDITMPNCDGIEATKMIRMMNTDVLIYAYTAAHVNSKFKTECKKVGMDGFFTKPIKEENILQIKKLIGFK